MALQLGKGIVNLQSFTLASLLGLHIQWLNVIARLVGVLDFSCPILTWIWPGNLWQGNKIEMLLITYRESVLSPQRQFKLLCKSH